MKKIFSIAVLALFSLTKAQFSVNVEAGSAFLSKDAILYSLDGSKDIILSKDNKKDIDEIKKDYIKDMKFHYVSEMIEVINLALMKEKVKDAREIKYVPELLKN